MALNLWPVSLLIVIAMTRIGMGIYNALSGPTLLYLAQNVNVRVGVLSTMFTGRSIGNLVGAILGGTSKKCLASNFRHSILLGIGIALLGFIEFIVPWITDFWLLMFDMILGGMIYGYLDAVNPFLETTNPNKKSYRCSDDEAYVNTSASAFNSSNIDANDNPDGSEGLNFRPILLGWSYILAATWLLVVSFLMIALSLMKVEGRVSSVLMINGTPSENRDEEPLKNLMWVFITIIGYYFFGVTVANIPYYFTYSIAICSEMGFSTTDAATLNAIFWLGYGIGRITGAFVSKCVQPRTIISICIAGAIFDMNLMSIWGKHNAVLTWIMIGLHGFTTSMLYPSGVSWLSEITNVSGTYMFIFNVGNALGSFTMSPLAGYIFDIHPFSVIYMVLGLACGNTIVFAIANIVGTRHLKNIRRKCAIKQDDDAEMTLQNEESTRT